MLAVGPVGRVAAAALAAFATACAGVLPAPPAGFERLPRVLRTGQADMAIERVEADVARAEVEAAVQALVAVAPICLPWPGVWLDPMQRRNLYVVRYDLMARDWGGEAAQAGGARMREFVEAGFLTSSERPDLGDGAMEYVLTPAGAAALNGSPYGGPRPAFCGPSQRRVVEIVALEHGDYPCGSLHVRFRHVMEAWPAWAATEAARARLDAAYDLGAVGEGTVSLSRQWFRPPALPEGRVNGELRSLCYDRDRGEATGDDLDLAPG